MPLLRSLPISFPPHTVVVLRVDFNVPLDQSGHILDPLRIKNHKDTIEYLLKTGCKIVLLAHLGKPNGKYKKELSFAPLLSQFEKLLNQTISLQSLVDYSPGADVVLIENIRFFAEEEENEMEFSQKLASLGTVYINDAFSVSHRAHASTVGITNYLPSFAGPALQKEYNALEKVLRDPSKPVTLIVGGKKVSDKIGVLEHLAPKVDHILVGGACANVFYRAQGKDVGSSYVETGMIETCMALLEKYAEKIVLPTDFVGQDKMYLDIGIKTIGHFGAIIKHSHTVIWAGPMGKYEETPFAQGTVSLLDAIVSPTITSIIGGGDTIAALQSQAKLQNVSLVSLGGGAMLEFLAKEHLPATDCLLQR